MDSTEASRGSTALPADVPRTDREWLTRVEGKLDSLIDKIQGPDGKGGLCEQLARHEAELADNKKWRMWMIVGMILLIALISGRYIFGPTSIPLVP
jgi:hypothetical protein